MKNKKIVIVGIFLLVSLIVGPVFFKGSNDQWICKDGQWIRQGSPKVSQPQTPCQGARTGEELPSIPPDSTVVSFYSWLLKNTDALSSQSYKKSQYLTDSYKQKIPQLIASTHDSAYKPFVCADIQPSSYKIIKSSTTKQTATVEIEETFETGKKTSLVQLQTQGKDWKIQNVICP